MEVNNFYGKSLSASGSLANNSDSAGVNVFAAVGTKFLNTAPSEGFRSAIGSTGLASKFYGADGDTSAPATTVSATATPAAVTTTTASVFTLPQASLGFNIPTFALIAVGAVIGFYVSKKNIL